MSDVTSAQGMDPSGVRFVLGMGAALAALAITAAVTVPAGAQDEGVKQAERLAKSAGSTVEAIVETKRQLSKTLEAYNEVLADDVKDRQSAYKTLQKEIDATEKKRAEIAKRVGEMDLEANTLFKSWSTSAAAMDNGDLRKRTEQRLADTKASYAKLKATGDKAGGLYEPVLKSLKDQVKYLGHDLNPAGVASLKPDAAKLGKMAQELYARIDDSVAVANKNIDALRPE
jgi:hypothetical protein